ncbi:MAG: adenylosuccinate lyase [Patescibacteria group bacterium]|nr:adenylosuccinate lyase [Patescibacteria group bacterium]
MENAISPLDNRYYNKIDFLARYFSEMTLFKKRLHVEVQYLILLSGLVPNMNKLSVQNKDLLNKIVQNFNISDYKTIKNYEHETNHDIKALEYYLREKLSKMNLSILKSYVHLGLTSEDANNLSYSLIVRDFAREEYIMLLKNLLKVLDSYGKEFKNLAMAGRTHGQKAVTTTLGKEFSVWAYRLNRQITQVENFRFFGKLNGAVGNYNALALILPKADWLKISREFVRGLGLEWTALSTQTEGYDSLVEFFDLVRHINNIMLDMCQDLWRYISDGYLRLTNPEKNIGSSTMPQKVNPIGLENAEGNLLISNSLLVLFSNKLPISRLQRDLSDSTIRRNIGVAMGHSVLAICDLNETIKRLVIDKDFIKNDLMADWSVLAEAVQVFLRYHGYERGFELVNNLTAGKKLSGADYKNLVKRLPVEQNVKKKLLSLTPQNYLGLSQELAEKALQF